MKLAVVQTKPRKGDLAGNLAALGDVFAQLVAEERPYDLIVLPEAALTGYFLEGAVHALARPAAAIASLVAERWAAAGGGRVDLVLGFYEADGGSYYNSAAYLELDGASQRIVHVHRKLFLPTYGVFDEARFVSRGRRFATFPTRLGTVALLICEDAWHALMPTLAALRGARYLIVPSASPGRGFVGGGELDNVRYWRDVMRSYAVEHGMFAIYAGLAGFEGGKGMSGSSLAIDPFGRIVGSLPALGAAVLRAELDDAEIDLARARLPLLGDLGEVMPDLLRGGEDALL